METLRIPSPRWRDLSTPIRQTPTYLRHQNTAIIHGTTHTCPLTLTIASSSSTMSRYTSFWEYFTPAFLHGMAETVPSGRTSETLLFGINGQ